MIARIPSSGSPYESRTQYPSTRPDAAAHAPVRARVLAVAAQARRHSPHAATAPNIASAETDIQIAAGPSARNGAARRAPNSAPSRRSVISTATGVVAAITVTTSPAASPLPSPIRTRTTKKRSAPGG